MGFFVARLVAQRATARKWWRLRGSHQSAARKFRVVGFFCCAAFSEPRLWWEARSATLFNILLMSDRYDELMYFVYILLSEKDHRTYVGFSNDVMARLKRHNAGHVAATKNRRPLRVLFYERFKTEKEAKEREFWWKSSTGRNRLKSIFKEGGF